MGKTPSETQLQSRLRNDDKSALEYVYKTYKDAFFNYALRFDISKEDISDIYQDSVIAMYQKFVTNKLELEKSTIKTYLFGIGKHKIYRFLNHNKREIIRDIQTAEYDEISLREEHIDEKQLLLSKNLSLISESCQTLLKLYYYRGLTINEILERTNYKDSNTVRSHKSRCVKRLKSLFKVI